MASGNPGAMLVVERDGQTPPARIGMMRTLHPPGGADAAQQGRHSARLLPAARGRSVRQHKKRATRFLGDDDVAARRSRCRARHAACGYGRRHRAEAPRLPLRASGARGARAAAGVGGDRSVPRRISLGPDAGAAPCQIGAESHPQRRARSLTHGLLCDARSRQS
jgi:hypothetical protein